MMSKNSRRGRPKGTGIDDSDRMAQLAELLRSRPDLKPTTAIRLMGFSDPSTIRRLRDKYKVYVAEQQLEPTATSTFYPQTRPTPIRQSHHEKADALTV